MARQKTELLRTYKPSYRENGVVTVLGRLIPNIAELRATKGRVLTSVTLYVVSLCGKRNKLISVQRATAISISRGY